MSRSKVRTCELMVLDDATNATVAKLPWRAFPGVLLQGDSLKILHDDVREAAAALRESDIASATEVLDDIDARIGDLLSRYEAALNAAGIELPYSKETRS